MSVAEGESPGKALLTNLAFGGMALTEKPNAPKRRATRLTMKTRPDWTPRGNIITPTDVSANQTPSRPETPIDLPASGRAINLKVPRRCTPRSRREMVNHRAGALPVVVPPGAKGPNKIPEGLHAHQNRSRNCYSPRRNQRRRYPADGRPAAIHTSSLRHPNPTVRKQPA